MLTQRTPPLLLLLLLSLIAPSAWSGAAAVSLTSTVLSNPCPSPRGVWHDASGTYLACGPLGVKFQAAGSDQLTTLFNTAECPMAQGVVRDADTGLLAASCTQWVLFKTADAGATPTKQLTSSCDSGPAVAHDAATRSLIVTCSVTSAWNPTSVYRAALGEDGQVQLTPLVTPAQCAAPVSVSSAGGVLALACASSSVGDGVNSIVRDTAAADGVFTALTTSTECSRISVQLSADASHVYVACAPFYSSVAGALVQYGLTRDSGAIVATRLSGNLLPNDDCFQPAGLSLNNATNVLYISCNSPSDQPSIRYQSLAALDLSTSSVQPVLLTSEPCLNVRFGAVSVVADWTSGRVVLACLRGDVMGAVGSANVTTVVSNPCSNPISWLEDAATGSVFVACAWRGALQVSADGSVSRLFASSAELNACNVRSVLKDATIGAFYFGCVSGSASVLSLSAGGVASTVVRRVAPCAQGGGAVVQSPVTGQLFAVCLSSYGVVAAWPNGTGVARTFGGSCSGSQSLVADARGIIYASCASPETNAIQALDSATGTISVVTTESVCDVSSGTNPSLNFDLSAPAGSLMLYASCAGMAQLTVGFNVSNLGAVQSVSYAPIQYPYCNAFYAAAAVDGTVYASCSRAPMSILATPVAVGVTSGTPTFPITKAQCTNPTSMRTSAVRMDGSPAEHSLLVWCEHGLARFAPAPAEASSTGPMEGGSSSSSSGTTGVPDDTSASSSSGASSSSTASRSSSSTAGTTGDDGIGGASSSSTATDPSACRDDIECAAQMGAQVAWATLGLLIAAIGVQQR